MGIFLMLMLGLVGVALITYGRKQGRGLHIGAGLVLLVAPYFLRQTVLQVILAVVVLGALAVASRLGY